MQNAKDGMFVAAARRTLDVADPKESGHEAITNQKCLFVSEYVSTRLSNVDFVFLLKRKRSQPFDRNTESSLFQMGTSSLIATGMVSLVIIHKSFFIF